MKHTMKNLILNIDAELRNVGNYYTVALPKMTVAVIGNVKYIRTANKVEVLRDNVVVKTYNVRLSVYRFLKLVQKLDDAVEDDWTYSLVKAAYTPTDADTYDVINLADWED